MTTTRTTATVTTYALGHLPSLTPPSSPKLRTIYPLLDAAPSRSFHELYRVFSNGSRITSSFHDGDSGDEDMQEEAGDHDEMPG